MAVRKYRSFQDWHEICHSPSFWRGVAKGFALQCYLLPWSSKPLQPDDDSVYYAWLEVGSLLTEACDKFGSELGETFKTGGAVTSQVQNPPAKTGAGVPLPPSAPLRVIMNGDRLDIQASVNLEGLKKLRTMLEKYQSILEMMQPEKDEAAN